MLKFFVLALLPLNCYAYVDPGSGLLLLQLLGAFVLGIIFKLKYFISIVKNFFKKK